MPNTEKSRLNVVKKMPSYGTTAIRRNVSYFKPHFETVDWTHSSDRDHVYRRALEATESHSSFVPRLMVEWFNHAQGWVVCVCVAVITGFLAGCVEIGREWAFDLKLGICLRGFWNDRHDCCRDSPDELECATFSRWGDLLSNNISVIVFINHCSFVLVAVLMAAYSAWLVQVFAPFAAGTGIPEIKTIMGGFTMRGFLGGRTLLVKCLGLILSVSSGLSLGLEAAYVHVACCVGHILARRFSKYEFSEIKRRELLSASAAAGISVAFGAPIGGILFSLEQLSSYFPMKTLWRSFFCAIFAVLALRTIQPLHSGKLVAFEVSYHYNWKWFELPMFVIIGVIGGLCGSAMLKMITTYGHIRRTTRISEHPIKEVIAVTFVTAVVNYRHEFLGKDTTAFLAALYSDCIHHGRQMAEDICVASTNSTEQVAIVLLSCAAAKLVLTVFAVNLMVPGGHLVPCMAVGACIGRAFGLVLSLIEKQVGDSGYFAQCAGEDPCITPGAYAIIASGALLSGVTRMTLSVVVILFEVTGGLEYVAPIMLAVMVAKWVSDAFGRTNIYDEQIALNGYPYLDNKMDFIFHDTAADVMKDRELSVIEESNQTLASLRNLIEHTPFSGFPIVNDRVRMGLLGYITRNNLEAVINRATQDNLSEDVPCFFVASEQPATAKVCIDLSPWMDQSPIELVETTPLNRVIEFFRALRLRYILVVRNGRLVGIITKRDTLRRIDLFRGRETFVPQDPQLVVPDPSVL